MSRRCPARCRSRASTSPAPGDGGREPTATECAALYRLPALDPLVLTDGLLTQPAGGGWLLRDVVKNLRRKLGDSAADPRYIVTEPRVGYRMAAGEKPDPSEGG